MRLRAPAIAALWLINTASAATHNVPGDFATIAAAEAAAADGDTIKLAGIRFQEAIVTSKRLRFVGTSGTIWDGFFGATENDQLTATADNVIVKGIEFQHGDAPLTITGDNAKITGCTFRSCEHGLLIDGAGADVSKNDFFGLYGEDEWAIEIAGGDSVVTKNVVKLSYCFGVYLDAESGGTVTMTDNVFETNQYYGQVLIRDAVAPVVKKNTMSNCYMSESAIEVVNSDDAMVVGNVVEHMNYDVTAGINVSGERAFVSKNLVQMLNTYDDDNYGIYIDGDDAVVEKNKVRANTAGEDHDTYGIYVGGDNALVDNNHVSGLGGGGNDTFGIYVEGQDAKVSKNYLRDLNDEYTRGIYVEGDRSSISKNDVFRVMYGFAIEVVGDDFAIFGNTLKKGNYSSGGIYAEGDATAPGASRIENNTISKYVEVAIELWGDGCQVTDNVAKLIANIGIYVDGDQNELTGNDISKIANDGFQIVGDNNILTQCTVKNSNFDGFDINGDGNSVAECVAKECAAEGLDNGDGSTNTSVRKSTFKGCRIDFAGAGALSEDVKNQYQTGDPGMAPEID